MIEILASGVCGSGAVGLDVEVLDLSFAVLFLFGQERDRLFGIGTGHGIVVEKRRLEVGAERRLA